MEHCGGEPASAHSIELLNGYAQSVYWSPPIDDVGDVTFDGSYVDPSNGERGMVALVISPTAAPSPAPTAAPTAFCGWNPSVADWPASDVNTTALYYTPNSDVYIQFNGMGSWQSAAFSAVDSSGSPAGAFDLSSASQWEHCGGDTATVQSVLPLSASSITFVWSTRLGDIGDITFDGSYVDGNNEERGMVALVLGSGSPSPTAAVTHAPTNIPSNAPHASVAPTSSSSTGAPSSPPGAPSAATDAPSEIAAVSASSLLCSSSVSVLLRLSSLAL